MFRQLSTCHRRLPEYKKNALSETCLDIPHSPDELHDDDHGPLANRAAGQRPGQFEDDLGGLQEPQGLLDPAVQGRIWV